MLAPAARIAIAALVLAGGTFVATAPRAAGVSADKFIQQWDADHDGTLSLEEIRRAASAKFDALDRDHDGTLDRRELGATLSVRELRNADLAKDRKLDKTEYLGIVEKRFHAADANHDGKLDRKELSSPAGRSLLRLFGSRQGPLF